MTVKRSKRCRASFRDPSGFVFYRDGVLYRQVNPRYRAEYDLLMRSGLYENLVSDQLLVPHEEVEGQPASDADGQLVLKPRPVSFVSYPYEWSFSQLKDAALLTLEIQKRALEHGMILKDASAFNVLFEGARPVFIDTLSFATYEANQPWIPYRQFCQHFLAPLLLMSSVDVRLGKEAALHTDGVPLDLASELLPRRTWLRPSLLMHLHLHARSIRRFGGRTEKSKVIDRGVSRSGLDALVASLERMVERSRSRLEHSEWADYDHTHGYEEKDFLEKKQLVGRLIERCEPKIVWDLGANVGTFSRVAAEAGARVVSIDGDPAAVEANYQTAKAEGDERIVPLWIDLANPSPALGWAQAERLSLTERGPADVALALALVHHLAITNNVPFSELSEWMATIGRRVIVEFVPKGDPQAQRLLVAREDIFSDYSREAFETEFQNCFAIEWSREIGKTGRWLYMMKRLGSD